jgi:hypothetical protein
MLPAIEDKWAVFLTSYTVEWLRATTAFVAGPQHDHTIGVLLYSVKCDMSGNIHARSGWAGMFPSTRSTPDLLTLHR